MAALNFPSSPTDGQTYTANGVTYTYSASRTAWELPATGLTSTQTALFRAMAHAQFRGI